MTGLTGKILSAALAGVAVAALAAGCATQQSAPSYRSSAYYTGADRLYRDNFVRNTRPHAEDRSGGPQFAAAPPAAPKSLAAYDGIAGARFAHETLPDAQAELVDGACEPQVKILPHETLYDIEKFCDVPVSMLLAYNPQLRSARHVPKGAWIEIPQIPNPDRAAFVSTIAPSIDGLLAAVAYVVQPGDSLNTIAGKHLVSMAQVANANPTIDWVSLPVGATVWIPAAQSPLAPAAPTGAAAPAAGSTTGSLPYQFKHSGKSGTAYDVTTVMPYQLTPAQEATQINVPRNLLTIDRRTVEPGGKVTVSGKGLPGNATVSLYSGANGSQMRFVKTVRTDADGTFEQSLSVDSSGGIGGVIFEALVDEDGTRLQSPRVGTAR